MDVGFKVENMKFSLECKRFQIPVLFDIRNKLKHTHLNI